MILLNDEILKHSLRHGTPTSVAKAHEKNFDNTGIAHSLHNFYEQRFCSIAQFVHCRYFVDEKFLQIFLKQKIENEKLKLIICGMKS